MGFFFKSNRRLILASIPHGFELVKVAVHRRTVYYRRWLALKEPCKLALIQPSKSHEQCDGHVNIEQLKIQLLRGRVSVGYQVMKKDADTLQRGPLEIE